MTEELISNNPATLEEVGRTPVSSAEDVHRTVERAQAALGEWKLDVDRRKGLLAACSYRLMEHQEELAELIYAEVGRPVAEAAWEPWIAAKAFATMRRLDWAEERQAPEDGGRTATIRRHPYGVVAAIVPWNFPVFLTAAKVAAALAAGNTIVVKPAESVSLVIGAMVRILSEVLPEGVIGIVHGGPDVANALVDERHVRKVSFTGSIEVGRHIMSRAARTLTPVTLELGGNDPAIVLDDAHLEYTATSLAKNALMNTGQMCIAPKRAYVPADRVEEFCEIFGAVFSGAVVGDGKEPGVTVGPLQNERQLSTVTRLLEDAVNRGGTIVVGGERGTDQPGHFLQPTLVRDVDDSVDLVSTEQFGPVFPVVAYTDLDSVIDTVNGQEYGLGASVWSTDSERARGIADRIEAGTVWINQHNALEVGLPFGGVKASGFGREGSTDGIDDFSEWRVVSGKNLA